MSPIIANESEINILKKLRIPAQPDVLLQLRDILQRPKVVVHDVATLIERDASLSGGVLSVVNSPAFRRSKTITSIRDAVNLLGLQRAYTVARTVAIRNAVDCIPGMQEFGRVTAQVAEACVAVVRATRRHDLLDDAYLVGLFHWLGVLAMRSVFPMTYEDIEQRAVVMGWSKMLPYELERWQTHHARLAALILQDWHLAPGVVHAVDQQHAYCCAELSESIPDDAKQLLAILKLSLHATQGSTDIMTDNEWDHVQDCVMETLELSETAELYATIQQAAYEAGSA